MEFNGSSIQNMPELPKSVAANRPGTKSEMKVIRNGQVKTLNIELGELPEEVAQESRRVKGKAVEQDLGLVVQEITPEVQSTFGTSRSEGVVITNVQPGSVAANSGLAPGDVILEINKKKITNLDGYGRSMDSAKPGQNILFLVQRGSNTIYVALKPEAGNDKG